MLSHRCCSIVCASFGTTATRCVQATSAAPRPTTGLTTQPAAHTPPTVYLNIKFTRTKGQTNPTCREPAVRWMRVLATAWPARPAPPPTATLAVEMDSLSPYMESQTCLLCDRGVCIDSNGRRCPGLATRHCTRAAARPDKIARQHATKTRLGACVHAHCGPMSLCFLSGRRA